MEAVYRRRKGFPPAKKGAGGERPPKGEQGPARVDLSVLCEGLFVSGLPSSRIASNGKKGGRDDG
jgi:hypothetical protein